MIDLAMYLIVKPHPQSAIPSKLSKLLNRQGWVPVIPLHQERGRYAFALPWVENPEESKVDVHMLLAKIEKVRRLLKDMKIEYVFGCSELPKNA